MNNNKSVDYHFFFFNKGFGGLQNAVILTTVIIFLSVLDITQVLCVVSLLGL